MIERIVDIEKDSREFTVTAFLGGKVIGDAGINKIRNHIKSYHREYFGISILKEYCNKGLGKYMLDIALEEAKKNGFEQVELGVFEDNQRTIHLYEKCGFEKIGIQPRAFKLKDGTYKDEVQMVNIF